MYSYFSHQAFFGNSVLSANKDTITTQELRQRYADSMYTIYKNRLNSLPALEPATTTSREALSIPILTYHAFLPEQKNEDHAIEDFENHMFALKAAGYHTITTEDYYQFMQGTLSLPTKSVLITFDDGRAETYYPADPLFHALGFNGSLHVITNHILYPPKNSYYLSKEELQEAQVSGRWEIQGHAKLAHDLIPTSASGTMGLFLTNYMWLSDIQRFETDEEYANRIYVDFKETKEDIENLFGITPISYAIPRGDFGDTASTTPILLAFAKNFFPISFFQVRPDIQTGYYSQNYKGIDDMSLSRRIKVPLTISGEDLIKILDGGQDKTIPYRDTIDNTFQWVNDSSLQNPIIIEKKLYLEPHANKTSSHLFLDGTQHWKNYTFHASTLLKNGKAYKLLARVLNGENYVACVYYENRIRIQHMSDGVEEVLTENRWLAFDPYREQQTAISVHDNTISCYINNRIVIQAVIPEGLAEHGGIGFKIWDPLVQNNTLVVSDIYVE